MPMSQSFKKTIGPLLPMIQLSRIRYPKLNRLGRLLQRGSSSPASPAGAPVEIEALRTAHKDFVESVSHELRTPLTSLRLSVQLLQGLTHSGRIEHLSPEKLSHLLTTADRQIDRLKTLMDVFLEASTMKAECLDLKPESLDLREIVREEIARFKADSRLSGRPVRVSARGRTQGYWDKGRIQQVLRNLLANAFLYGQDQAVEVRISGGPRYVTLSIQDHGIGISRRDQKRIFAPFERAVPGTHYNGMGLGLYVARQIAVAHQGDLKVRSRLGEGATFILRLPLGRAGVVSLAA
jgi:signal transduction histidine kinase